MAKKDTHMDEFSCLDLLESLFDGVYHVDREMRITYWNRAAERISGYRAAEVLGKKCRDNILRHIDEDGNELCLKGCPLDHTLQDGRPREANVFLHHKQGYRVPVAVRISPVRNRQGEITGCVEIFTDNSSFRQIVQDLEKYKKEAFLDRLTAIGNRRYSEMTLKKRLHEKREFNTSFGVIFFDIDHFKTFNDNHGHLVGDEVLVMVGKTAAAALRRFDLIARWGGEEFIIIISELSEEDLQQAAERIRVFVEKSFIMAGSEKILVTVSLGATLASAEDSLESLLNRVDRLMYQSKEAGRNRVTLG